MLFENTYKKMLYEILTESIAGISPSILGFSSSMTQLPDKKPYGFWMDRHGNFIIVPNSIYSHAGVGLDILNKAKQFDKTLNIKIKSDTQVYNILFKLGWLRITLHSQYLYYENPKITKSDINSIQKRNIEFIKEFYDLKDIVIDVP